MTKHYTFDDYATQGYLALVGVLMLLFHNPRTPLWPYLFVAHGLTLGLVHATIQAHAQGRGGRGLDFLRHFYPVLLYTGFYRETGELHHMFSPEFLDPVFIRLEEWIFGFQPCLVFMERFPSGVLSEAMYAAYFTYYVMIFGVGLALYLRDRGQFQHYVAVVSFVFYVCYLIYIFLPVMGPRAFYRDWGGVALSPDVMPAVVPDFPASVQSGFFFQLMAWIYRTFEASGAAFPSSHVAVAVVTVYFSFRYLRPIRYVHLTDVALLCTATVYCRYHYVVDVVAGLATAGLLLPLANRLYARFAPPPETTSPLSLQDKSHR